MGERSGEANIISTCHHVAITTEIEMIMMKMMVTAMMTMIMIMISNDKDACKRRYGALPVVYRPRPVGMMIKWSPAGLVKSLELQDDPREEFMMDAYGGDEGQ
jgi:hypothetical protein